MDGNDDKVLHHNLPSEDVLKSKTVTLSGIKDKIHKIRGMQVMLDSDLAAFYGVETKRLNEQVRRNSERFPPDFMFQLAENEAEILRTHFATSSENWGGRL